MLWTIAVVLIILGGNSQPRLHLPWGHEVRRCRVARRRQPLSETSCVLSTSATIAGNKCKEEGLIPFYIDGKLKSCVKPYN